MSNNNPNNDDDNNPSDFKNLQANFNQQQAKIEALKEMLRKTEATQGQNTANAQEKVRNIAQRLTHLKAKARSRHEPDQPASKDVSMVANISDVSEPLTTTTTATSVLTSSDDDDQQMYTSTTSIPTTMIPTTLTVTPHQQIVTRARSETPASDKILLLRKQMEQNRQKMAEHENTKRGIVEMVSQLRANIDDNQMNLEKSSQLGRSIGDLSKINKLSTLPLSSSGGFRERNKSISDFNHHVSTTTILGGTGTFNTTGIEKERLQFLERRVKELEIENKIKDHNFFNKNPESEHLKTIKNLENKIVDLEETLNSQQSIITARTQAVSLLSESLSLKGKSTVDMLEDTKQEMLKMQENFIQNEGDFQLEKDRLKMDIEDRSKKIQNMEEINDILETAKFDLTIENGELRKKLDNVQDYTIKLNELNTLNDSLQKRILELETTQRGGNISVSDDSVRIAEEDETVQLSKKVNIEQLLMVKTLEDQIEQLKLENARLLMEQSSSNDNVVEKNIIEIDVQEKIDNLEQTIDKQRLTIEEHLHKITQLEDTIVEKSIEYNVLNANYNVLQEKFTTTSTPKPLFSMTTDENAEMEITKLKTQLDDANKNMIKMKITSKQLQKQIDTLKKSSDINTELVKRTEENQRLQLRITELENERKHFHTQPIDINHANKNDLEQKIEILETTCQNQNSAIQLLEEQKIDINDDLQTTKSELTTLKDRIKDLDHEEQSSENVMKHMDSIEMEETVDKYSKEIDQLKLRCDKLTNENYDLNHRLARHVTENIELLDKIEKLNKGSSAESIEIVERLTQQEKLEIEQYLTVKPSQSQDAGSKQTQRISESSNDSKNNASDNPIPTISVSQQMETNSNEQTNELHDINENLLKLREENSELIYKIKLFTDERREVLDKMEIIQNENHHYLQQIDELNGIKKEQEEDFILLEREKFNAVESLKCIEDEKDTLLQTIREINRTKTELKEEINRLVKERETAAATTTTGPSTNNNDRLSFIQQELYSLILKLSNDNYKKSLKNLEIELENYRKTKDKNGKLNISRKLAKEAENVHILMGTLLTDITNIEQQLKEAQPTAESNDEVTFNQDLTTVNETQINLNIDVKELQQQLEECKLKLIESERVESVLKLEIETLMSEMQYQEKLDENKSFTVAEKLATVQDEYDQLKPTFDEQTVELQKLRNEYENHMIVTTNEIAILTKLVDEQKHQLIESITEHESELNEKHLIIDKLENQLKQLANELRSIKNDKQQSNDKYIDSLHKKVESLKLIFDENNDLLTQQAKELEYKQETIQTLNSQIMDLYKSMEEQTVNLYETKDEIERLETIIKENRIEYDQLKSQQNDSAAEIERLTNTVKEKLTIIENLQETKKSSMKENESQNCLETKIKENLLMSDEQTDLEKSYTNLQKKNQEQLEKLKKFAINLKKKNGQYLELEEKFKHLENEYKRKNNEFEILENQLKDRNTELNVIHSELITSQDNINLLKMENNKIENTLQQSHALNSIEIENQLQTWENENRTLTDQIANQTNYITELKANNDILKNDIQNLNTEMSNKLKLMEEQTKAYALLQKDSEDKEKLTKQKIEKCKQILREKNKEIKNLKEQKAIDTVPTSITAAIASESVQYKANCQEHNEKITNLQDTINELQLKIETIQTGNEGKVQENLMVIETLELEKINLQEKCIHLEEEMCSFESQRSSLEQELETINQKLQDQRIAFEENEKELIERVHNLVEQDKQMENKLKECEQEREELLNEMHESKDMAKQQLTKIQTLENELKYIQEIKLDQYEKDCTTLTNDNKTLQMEVQRLTNVLLKKEQENQNDFKQLEYDMSIQLQSLNTERKQLQENIERFNETISEQNQEINRLKEHVQNLEQENQMLKLDLDNVNYDQNEMSNLRMQIIHDQTEIDNLKSQNYSIVQNHELELQALRVQITELDTLRMQVGQNQTDDQVFIQNENERLHQLLIEREQEIADYKQTIEQHQQQPQISTVSTATSTDFIDSEAEIQNVNNNINLNDNDAIKMNIDSILNPITSDINQTENIPSFNSSIFFDSTAATNTPLVFDQNIQQEDLPEQIKQTTSTITKDELENQLGNVFSYLEKQDESDSMSMLKINKDELQNLKQELEIYQLKDQENSVKIFEYENDRNKMAIQMKDMENKMNELYAIVSTKAEQIELDVKHRNSADERLHDLQEKILEFEMQKNDLENQLSSVNIKFSDCLKEVQMKCTEIEELQCKEREYQEKSITLENQLKQYENEKLLSNIEQLIVPVTNTENQQINVATKVDPISSASPPPALITSDLPSFNSSIFFDDSPSDFNIHPLITAPPQIPTNIKSSADETDENRIPVVEEIIVPKKSYICHPEEKMSIDDGNYIQNVENLQSIALSETKQHQAEQEDLMEGEKIADLKRQIDDREKHLAELKIQFDNMNQFYNQKLAEFENYCSTFNEREQQYITRIQLIEKQFEHKNTVIELAPTNVEDMIIPIVHATETESVNILPTSTAEPNTDNLPSFNSSAFFNANTNNETTNDFVIDNLKNVIDLERQQQQKQQQQQQQQKQQQQQQQQQQQTLPQAPRQTLFDTNTEEDEYANRIPVQEEMIVPKKAYVCQPNIDDENKQMNPNEEGWGWGSDEAILEEQHQQKIAPTITASLIPSTSQTNFDIKLQESEDKIRELELERDRLREETIALKVKSGKMLKKLKEYQQRDNKSFKKSPSVESNELDIAIQDELKNQINVLEVKLNEIRQQQDKEKLEKSQLQKRIDVLSTANDNMIDIKERQDIEMQMNHTKIKELTMKLKQLEDWDDNQDMNSTTPKPIQNVITPQSNIVQSLSEQQQQQRPELSNDTYEELQKHIHDLSTDNEEFQALLEDEKQMNKLLESKLNQLQSSLMSKSDVEQNYQESLDKLQKLENNNQLLKYTIQECEQENENLKIKLTKLEEQIQTIDELSKETSNIRAHLNQLKAQQSETINENSNLLIQHEMLMKKNNELSNYTMNLLHEQCEMKIQELLAALQYKESEILHLNKKIVDVQQQDQTESLVQEILLKNGEIQQLKLNVNELQQQLEQNHSDSEYVTIIQELRIEIKKLESIQMALVSDKENMEKELQELNEQVLKSFDMEDRVKKCALDLDMKNIEIIELKNTIEEQRKQLQFASQPINELNQTKAIPTTTQSLDNSNDLIIKLQERIQQLENDITQKDQYLQTTVNELNAQWEEICERRCSELADSWRQHLQDREQEFCEIENDLQQQMNKLSSSTGGSTNINTTTATIDQNNESLPYNQLQLTKLQQIIDDKETYINNLQVALENQEIEIVTLKEQLAIRSAEYARIAARIDPFRQLSNSDVVQQASPSSLTIGQSLMSPSNELLNAQNNNSRGLQQKFDFALYLLHQSDMRYQELTEELKKLLEERDTLQLRLSNSIRQIEDYRNGKGSQNPSNVTTPEKLTNSNNDLNNESIANSQDNQNLTAKLLQLNTVNHLRDKRLLEERDQHQRHMSILQQDVDNIPQEAMAEMFGADYTLQRPSPQSSSSILLNWLWGTTSTPMAPTPQKQMPPN